MARSSVGETVQRIRRQLASSYRYEVAVLVNTLTPVATDTSVTLSVLAPSVIEGAVLSIGGEDMRVLTVDRIAKTCVVIRAWMDSELQAHVIGDEVAVNPRFSAFTILDAIREEITSWGPDLFRVFGATVPVITGARTFVLPDTMANAFFVIECRRNIAEYYESAWPELEVRAQHAPLTQWTASATSGWLIRVISPSWAASSVFVLVAMPFDGWAITVATDLVTDTGITPSMLEVVDLGVKYRLMSDAENDLSARAAQDDPRRNEETPAGAAIGVAGAVGRLYRRRRTEESSKLRSRYPIRIG